MSAILVLNACNGGNVGSDGISESEAIHLADRYIKEHYPFSRRDRLHPDAHDQGQTWIVTYELPEDSVGGTPTIEIDKSTGRVLHARHTQ